MDPAGGTPAGPIRSAVRWRWSGSPVCSLMTLSPVHGSRPRLDTLQRIELAEGVEIQLRPAGPTARLLAACVDLLIRIGIFVGLAILLAVAERWIGANVVEALLLLSLFGLEWLYFVWFESRPSGASPGKRAFGLRVVQVNGSPPALGQVVLRNLLRWIDFLPFAYLTGLVSCMLNRRFQRLGDLVADTLVVYHRPQPRAPSQPAGPVPLLAPPVALTREEQQAVVAFGDRVAMWTDSRREELASHAVALTGAGGREGVRRLLGMGQWIRQRPTGG